MRCIMTISVDEFFERARITTYLGTMSMKSLSKFAMEQLRETDTILFGQRTYELLQEVLGQKQQTTRDLSKDNLEIARLINNINKYRIIRRHSRRSRKRSWRNVKLIREVNPEEIKLWKQEPGKDLGIGGNNLAVSFAQVGLIDEIRIMVDPVVLGKGTPLFEGIKDKLNAETELLKTRTFKSWNVLL